MISQNTTSVSFREAADRVKASLDILQIIGRHITLKKRGRNWLGLCPFHREKTPSFNVNAERNVFKCFGCGEGGDAIAFLMKIEGKGFGDVIRELAEEQGILIETEIHGEKQEAYQAEKERKEKLIQLHEAAQQFYQQRLMAPDGKEALDYLMGRSLPAPLTQRFGLGYAPDGWEHLVQHLNQKFEMVQKDPALLEAAGLANLRPATQTYYDRFRHRLIIPIHDLYGRVIAFGGRALKPEDMPKYLNSPETSIYKKHQVLYGLAQAKSAIRQNHTAILMEGYFDVLAAHSAGVEHTVGTCGTALTEEQIQLLIRQGAETLILAFDADEAGIRAAMSGLDRIEPFLNTHDNLRVKVLIMPAGKDPDEFIRNEGPEAFQQLLATAAQDMYTFRFQTTLRGLVFDQAEDRIEGVNRITPLLARIQKPIVQSEMIRQYALHIGVSEEALQRELARYQQMHPSREAGFGGSGTSANVAKFTNVHHFQESEAILDTQARSFKRIEEYPDDTSSNALDSRRTDSSLVSSQPPQRLETVRTLPPGLQAAERFLLKLVFLNTETCLFMVSLLETTRFEFPPYQRLWDAIRQHPLLSELSPETSLDPVIHQLNLTFSEQPDVCRALADVVFAAEEMPEEMGWTSLPSATRQERVQKLAHDALKKLHTHRNWEKKSQLAQQLREIERQSRHQGSHDSHHADTQSSPLASQHEVTALELQYQFYEEGQRNHLRFVLNSPQKDGTERHD